MTILITGANGFIGSHLKEFLEQRYQYTILAPASSELDLTNETCVDTYINNHNIDVVIHAANRGGGRDTIGMKNLTEYNLRSFFNVMKYRTKMEKIISFGSGAEYGKHKPIVEAREDDYKNILPLDEYGLYKSITSRFIEQTDRCIQLRVFGAYGEYENYRYKFISNAIVKNLLNLPITIRQNVLFDYIYIGDLVRMIDYVIHNEMKEKIYNVARGEKIDLLTLANMINKSSAFASDVHVLEDGLNNEYTANNERIMQELPFFTFTSYETSIQKMRSYFQTRLSDLDIKTVKEDPYLKVIDTIWKG